MTVLLIDDDTDDIDVFEEVIGLLDKSIVFLSATSADTALQMLSDIATPPDHIFLDINMPAIDGMQCLAEIRKRFPSLPSAITMYSTTKEFSHYNKAIAMGAGFIVKPDEYRQLLDVLKQKFNTTRPN